MLRREHRRDARARLRRRSDGRRKKDSAALTRQPAAGVAGPAPSRSLKRHGYEDPDPLTRGGRGRVPSPGRLDPPPGPRRHSGDPRGLAGNGKRQPPARPRAPEGQPGALQEHHRGPGEARSRAQGRRAARQRDGPTPPRGKRAARDTQPTGGRRGSAASGDHAPHQLPSGRGRGSGVGPGSAPLPFHAPPRV